MNKHKQQPRHPFLAQMLFCYTGPTGAACASVNHPPDSPRPKPPAVWEVRFYQDMQRGVALYQQGKSPEEIAQSGWDETSREQDTIGVVCHLITPCCEECAQGIISKHGGQGAAFMTMETARVTGGALLLVSDRLTENAAIVGNLPGNIRDDELLARLDNEQMLDIRF
ncbi:MAG TPA: hypothetical protein VKX46_20945 [Ktedonobacteraceae bacterium]|jgi:hypothetical protein|nr:hypothetical protein [Ktedonobacteraceae bacterium]